MITFPHIEDYLEVLGGYREITANGKSPGPINIFGSHNKVISLARYDVNIVSNMSSHTIGNGSLTDRQSELAVKLVDKYKRQFALHGVDVAPSVQNPQFRLAIRYIDRSKTIRIDNNRIVVRFPYDKAMVPEITAAAKESRGKFTFNRENKHWELALTESNVNWAMTFGEKHGFELDQQIIDYMDLILAAEKNPYKIELVTVNGDVAITNVPHSLYKYIEENLGGLNVQNFIKLIDNAPVLGYTVHKDIQQAIGSEYTPVILGLLINKESHVLRTDPGSSGLDLLEEVAAYAKITDRYPICVYEPDASDRLRNSVKELFAPSEVLDMIDKKITAEVDLTGIKCVYFNKMKRTWKHRIPILVSTNAMLYGGEKQAMLQIAEKVVYYTATTYNKEATQIAGNISY